MKTSGKLIFLFLAINFLKWSRGKHFKRVDTCDCGRHDELAARIVGGEETEPNQYPWMVAIFNRGSHHCGGSLINDRYVLTAGHCLKWSKKEHLTVIFGLHDRILRESEKMGGTSAEIEKIIIHENFSSYRFHDTNDVGLIKLKKSVKFGPEISPICLPKYGEDFSKNSAMIIGWGMTSRDGTPAQFLMKANVTVMSNDECKKVEFIGSHILDSMLCAYEDKTDACQGDSGGPLVHESDRGKMMQIGVVSWGKGCAEPGMPGVYARVTSYLKWIGLNTLDSTYCRNSV